MTEIAVELGCDCRVSTSFVGARYLALDIADRDAARPAAALAPAGRAAPEDPAARATREATAVATAEELLIQQIERAAGQGLVQLALTAPAAPPPAAPTPARARAVGRAPPPPPRPPADAGAIVAALDDEEQIEAVTVYDRDDAREIARRAEAAVPDACVADAALDVGDWATHAALARAAGGAARPAGRRVRPARRRGAAGARPLLRPHRLRRRGAGAARRLSRCRRPRRPGAARRPRAGGRRRATPAPTARWRSAYPCPGRHALWLALGGVAPAFHDAAGFAAVEAAFAELPADLRAQPRAAADRPDARRRAPGRGAPPARHQPAQRRRPVAGDAVRRGADARRRGRHRDGGAQPRRARRAPAARSGSTRSCRWRGSRSTPACRPPTTW